MPVLRVLAVLRVSAEVVLASIPVRDARVAVDFVIRQYDLEVVGLVDKLEVGETRGVAD